MLILYLVEAAASESPLLISAEPQFFIGPVAHRRAPSRDDQITAAGLR